MPYLLFHIKHITNKKNHKTLAPFLFFFAENIKKNTQKTHKTHQWFHLVLTTINKIQNACPHQFSFCKKKTQKHIKHMPPSVFF